MYANRLIVPILLRKRFANSLEKSGTNRGRINRVRLTTQATKIKTMTICIDMLVNEHKVILQVVGNLEKFALAMRNAVRIDAELLREAVIFMREYADKCHHGKEEDLLFPAFIDHGVPPQGCPIAALLHEHKSGRELVGNLDKAVDDFQAKKSGAEESMLAAIDGLAKLYPNHIWKEDAMVFPMTDNLLPVGIVNNLTKQFEALDARFGPDFFARHSDFVKRFSIAAERATAHLASKAPER